jgi:hypothetical protein
MITLEQVRTLESRVEKAVLFIDLLQEENASLKEKLSGYERRIQDLEVLVRGFQQDQGRIEEGILHALDRLNSFEDALLKDIEPAKEPVEEAPVFSPTRAAVAPAGEEEPKAEAPSLAALDEDAPEAMEEPSPEAVSDESQADGELDIF